MTEYEIIRHIDNGANFYLDFFANAKHMERVDTGFYCYTRPRPSEQGISFAYNIRLEGLPKNQQMEKIEEIKHLGLPVWWDLQMSDDLYRMIHGKDKEKAPLVPPDGEELYMAVTSPEQISSVRQSIGAVIRRVSDAESFTVWARLVDDWMAGGYQDIHPQNHYPACESGKIRCYICYKDEHPISVCSVMNNNGICSLEFVATHEDFRRQGFAKAICAFAMKEAFAGGARIITLRAVNPGTRELYTSLGFVIYNYTI